MAFDFKNLSEVEVQDKPTQNTTIMAFEGDKPCQIPVAGIRPQVIVIDLDDENTFNPTSQECFINYDPIYEALERGETVLMQGHVLRPQGPPPQGEEEEEDDDDSVSLPRKEHIVAWDFYPKIGLVCSTQSMSNIKFYTGSYHVSPNEVL